jgi:hypothetical protein
MTASTTDPLGTEAKDNAVRPFRAELPDEALDDLRRRIAATRFADKETVADSSQGAQLATIQEIARSWATGTTGATARRS